MRSLSDIPLLKDFISSTQTALHTPVPDGWFVIVSDVRGSTRAIEEGRYKDVNVVGASGIMAVINAVGLANVAFVFGGDGATLLVPGAVRESALRALLGTRTLAQSSFGLDLRVGCVPVTTLRGSGHEIKIARLQISPTQTQMALSGLGIQEAERLVKAPAPNPYLVDSLPGACEANFNGFECRWQPLQSRRGETLSLLIQADKDEVYEEVMRKIDTIFTDPSPVADKNLKLSRRFKDLAAEVRVRTADAGFAKRMYYWITQYLVTLVAAGLWETLKTPYGKRYREEVRSNSDFRKFDGVLRMVLDGTPDQRELLELYLEKRFQQKSLAYGLHISDSALMTCLIFERATGNHFHLVDGNHGGYAEAAKGLKTRLKALVGPSTPLAA